MQRETDVLSNMTHALMDKNFTENEWIKIAKGRRIFVLLFFHFLIFLLQSNKKYFHALDVDVSTRNWFSLSTIFHVYLLSLIVYIVLEILILFHKLMTWPILVQMIFNFNTMSTTQKYIFNVSFQFWIWKSYSLEKKKGLNIKHNFELL